MGRENHNKTQSISSFIAKNAAGHENKNPSKPELYFTWTVKNQNKLIVTDGCMVAPGVSCFAVTNTAKHLPVLEYAPPFHTYFLFCM